MAVTSIGSMSGGSSGSVTGQLDVQYIVEQMIFAKQQPIRDLEVYQNFYETKKTAFQDLNTKLSAVERSLYAISKTGFESKSVSSSESAVVTATASSTAQSGNYELTVKQMAKSQSSASTALASASDALLTGGTTLTLTQGDKSLEIAIEGETRSLNGLRNAINSSDLEMTASIINQGGAYYLQLTSDATGTDKAFTVSDDGVGTSVSTRQAAQDAQFYLNTDSVANPTAYLTRQSNSISDVIEGLTIQLKKVDPAPVSISIATDTANITEKIDTFVEQFNTAISFLNEQFTYDESANRAGVLSGESSARKAQTDLLGIVSSRVAGLEDSDNYKTLSTIGFTMDNDGKLAIDKDRLTDALENHLDNVVRLFKNQGSTSHSETQYYGKTNQTVAGTYAVNVSQVAEQALLTGDAALAGTLGADASANETLTFSLSGKSATVALTYDMNIDQIISAVNGAFETAGISALASETGNILSVRSQGYGSAYALSVSSSGTGVFSTSKTDTGVDVAGTLGGNAATGSGRLLTGNTGDTNGLMVFAESQTVGDKGTVSVSFGVGEQLRQRMYDLTFPYSGLLAKNVEALDSQLENIDLKISDINRRLAEEETSLIEQFSRANEALSQLQYLQTTLSNNFKS
jgi:flagellar hook-associated protein 2